jgi:hypothetical protein
MNRLRQAAWTFPLVFLASVGMACSALPPLPNAIPTFPPLPPTPASEGTPTGSSPMSGDWSARTDFGRLAFTVDPDGQNVTTVVVGLSNYTCGGTTITTEMQVLNVWSIADGQFSDSIDLNPGHIEDLAISGSYAAASKKFSGTWDDDEYGTHCKGTWESAARK